MKPWIDFIVTPETSIIETMAKINTNGRNMVFVCSVDGKVLATLTDGDIRRHILSGKSLNVPVIEAANKDFYFISSEEDSRNAYKICAREHLVALPRLDRAGRLVTIFFRDKVEISEKTQLSTPVVIMAGGKGVRLYPYTKVLPKPLVPIGEDTITEHIIKQFMQYGCNDFTMIVNHKKNMIKAYFADENHDFQVKFIDEENPLGTGGGLKLLGNRISETFFMTNCDILVFADYAEALQTHKEWCNIVTMVCAAKTVTIPYGTVEIDGAGTISSLTEKPVLPFLVNTGFYIIEPEFLNYINPDTFTPMTESIQACLNAGERVGVFPVSEEQWSDMGQLGEMEKMQRLMGI